MMSESDRITRLLEDFLETEGLLGKRRCILEEIRREVKRIEKKLDSRDFGLAEIKREVEDIEEKLDSPESGLDETKREVEDIERKLDSPESGLGEIKREIEEIEAKLDGMVGARGALSTGPFFVRTGENNAVNVKVQNIGESPIDVVVRLFDVEACPPVEIDRETLTDIGSCCAQEAVLTAPAGNFEVAICPDPADASIRAFVSVHSGNAPTSAFEYVFRASEMLPLVCPFCQNNSGGNC